MIEYVMVTPTGSIKQTGACSDSQFQESELTGTINLIVSGQPDGVSHYVLGNTVHKRPPNPVTLSKETTLANGIDAIEVSGIPLGAILTLGDISTVAEESVATLVFDVAGKYRFKVELFPYLPYEATIHAT